MPSLDGEFRILAIRDGLPTGGKGTVQIGLDQVMVDRLGRDTINTCAKSFIGPKVICGTLRIDIDVNRLGSEKGRKNKDDGHCDWQG